MCPRPPVSKARARCAESLFGPVEGGGGGGVGGSVVWFTRLKKCSSSVTGVWLIHLKKIHQQGTGPVLSASIKLKTAEAIGFENARDFIANVGGRFARTIYCRANKVIRG